MVVGGNGRLSRNRGTLALRRSLIINSYLYDLLLPVQLPSSSSSRSATPPPAAPLLQSRVPQAEPPLARVEPSGETVLLSLRLQISFLCRLIKLVWHISDFYHLISTPSVYRPFPRSSSVFIQRPPCPSPHVSVLVDSLPAIPFYSLLLRFDVCGTSLLGPAVDRGGSLF